jgi:hypothetical protein
MTRPGMYDTQDRWFRRTVQPGGIVRYDHQRWHHPALLDRIGQVIFLHAYAFDYVDAFECLWPGGTRGKPQVGRDIGELEVIKEPPR